MLFPVVLGVMIAGVQASDDPTVLVTPSTGAVETVASESASLLSKARSMKSQGVPAYGDIYRRAAWAAYKETPHDAGAALAVLDELLTDPGSVFDMFDAHRIAAQLHSNGSNWNSAGTRYQEAVQLARQDPTLVDAHPVLYVSIMQGAALAAANVDDHARAALLSVELRDHPSGRVPVRARRAASLSAARSFLRSGDEAGCEAAWTQAATIAPDLFEGRKGVFTRFERAKALSDLRQDPFGPLEELWNAPGVREHDTAIVVAFDLARNYLASQDPADADMAFTVFLEAFDAVTEHEQAWRSDLSADDKAVLERHTRILLHRATELALMLGSYQHALPLAEAYRARFDSSSDSRGAAWVLMAQTGLAGG